jgi:hypothetical protein
MKVKMLDPLRLARSQQKMFFFVTMDDVINCTTSASFICFFFLILVSPNLLIYDSLRLPFGTIHSWVVRLECCHD